MFKIGIKNYNKSFSESISTTTPDHNWQIVNKYYSADVVFKIIEQENELDKETDAPAVIILASRSIVSFVL